MILTNVFKQVLTEGEWADSYEAGIAAKKYPHKFIHFSDINKLGINPKKSHRDPHGIYFYPIDWLMDRMAGWPMQYAVTMKYYFIVNIDLNAVGSVDLGRMTIARARAIATKNGWITHFDKVNANPAMFLSTGPMDSNLWKRGKVGAIFYATMDYLVNVEKSFSWLQLLKGVPLLYDPGHGIINANEKSQVLVIDRKVIHILDSGLNKNVSQKSFDRSAIMAIEKLQGTYLYKNGLLQADVSLDGAPVHLTFDLGNLKLKADYYYHGLKGSKNFKIDFSALERDEQGLADYILWHINTLKGEAEKTGNDPVWTIDKINTIVNQVFGNQYKLRQQFLKNGELYTGVVFNSDILNRISDLQFRENNKGTLNMYSEAELNGNPDKTSFKFDKKYVKNTKIETIVNDFQKAFATFILNRKAVKYKKTSAWTERLKFGFQYGSFGPSNK